MRLFVIAFFASTFFLSCAKVKLISTSSNNVELNDGSFVFENDTVKVKYNFWAHKGVMNFEIINKTNRTIYFDWKKSAFLPKNIMMSYWQDETNTVSESTSFYYYRLPIASNSSKSKSVRKERVGVVPPKAIISNSLYILTPGKTPEFKKGNYNSGNTPFAFRNYLTMSFDEDFKSSEFTIDNDFYVSSIEVVKDAKKLKYKSGNKFWLKVY